MKRISILCPTRKRIHNMLKLLNSIERTTENKNLVDVWFYIDDDDEDTKDALPLKGYNFTINYKTGPRLKILSNYWNTLYKLSDGDILMLCGDDIVFRTQDWDSEIIKEFENTGDEILLVYGSDLLQNEKLATHPFLSRKAANILGYVMPPYFAAWHNDRWLHKLFTHIKRIKYRGDIITEHEHYITGKSLFDITYKEQEDKLKEADKTWQAKKSEIDTDAQKLIGYIEKCRK